jgi:hypothetical protein
VITKSADKIAVRSSSLAVELNFVIGTPQDLAMVTTESSIGVPKYALTPVEVI